MHTISVIIATYNRSQSLKDTLDSLLAQEQDGSFDYEILVVDNNSQDRTKETVKSYLPKFNGKLKYLFEPKQGKSFALNSAIKEAKGEVISFTDDDVILPKDWLKQIKAEFEINSPDCLLGASFLINENGEKRYFLAPEPDLIMGMGLNMSLKRRSLVEIGFFDTNLGPGSVSCSCEDLDIVYRFLTRKKKVIYSENVQLTHKPRPSNAQAILLYERDAMGRSFCFLKHFVTRFDIFALKKIYETILSLTSDYFLTFKNRNIDKRKVKIAQIRGALKGIWLGSLFYLFKINNNQTPKVNIVNVAYIHGNSNIIAGQEIVLLNIVKNINRARFEPLVVLPEKGIFSDLLSRNGIGARFINLSRFNKKNPFPFIVTLFRLYILVLKKKVKIIHVSGLFPNQYASIVGKLTHVPIICHIHSTIYGKKEINNSLLKLADIIITVSKGVSKNIQVDGIDVGKIRVVYNGIDINNHFPDESKINRIREYLGIDRNAKIVGQIGQIIERKGIMSFIKMAELVIKESQNVRFLLVGDDRYEPGYMDKMKKLASSLYLDKYIIFTGFQENVSEFIKAMDIVVLNSLIEGFGNVLIETMLLEKPVVATDIAGPNEIIENNFSGILVPVNDSKAMANSVLKLLNNNEHSKIMVNNAKNIVLSKFSIEKQVSEVTNIYERLLSGKKD